MHSSLPRLRFPLRCSGSSKPWRKSTGDNFFVTCFSKFIFKLAMGCPSTSGSSGRQRFRLVSAGNEATTRRRLYLPTSVRRWGRPNRWQFVSSTKVGWLVGEKGFLSYKKLSDGSKTFGKVSCLVQKERSWCHAPESLSEKMPRKRPIFTKGIFGL